MRRSVAGSGETSERGGSITARLDEGPHVGDSIGRVSTTEALANRLTADIVDGSLEAGAHLPEVELSLRFGVSRQSLRAAMAELVHRGLLRREPHRGFWVPILTQADVRDMFLMREVIESEAIRRVASAPDSLAAVDSAVDRLEALPDDVSWSRTVEADVEIHRAIVVAVGSRRMLRAYELLNDEFRLSAVPARRYLPQRDTAREHRELLEVIRAGDPEAAVLRFRRHLELGLDDLLRDLPEG